MWVRLTRKLANRVDGVDLSVHNVGDVFEVTRREAELLIAEGWAEPDGHVNRHTENADVTARIEPGPAIAPDVVDHPWTPLQMLDRLREVRRQIEARSTAHGELRRAEDRIREKFRDEQARVVSRDESPSSDRTS